MSVKRPPAPPVRRDLRFCAILLAAGAGRRFGGGKLSAPFRGGWLVDAALASAWAAPAASLRVVVGADEAVAERAGAFARREGEAERLRVCRAQDWAEGLSASLRAGLTAVPDGAEAAFVFLGDMPDVPETVAWRLAEAWDDAAVDAVEPVHEGEAGHPVLIGRRLWPAVARLTGDRGARSALRADGVRRVEVEVASAGVRLDVDTPDALRALQAREG